jgi:hypothetical protein
MYTVVCLFLDGPLQEICNVIDQTLGRDAEEPYAGAPCYAPLACHRWDKNLSSDTLFEILQPIPFPKDDTSLTSNNEDDKI